MSYLRIFDLKFKECIVIIEIIFEIFLKEKFCAKKKVAKLRTKNELFVLFGR